MTGPQTGKQTPSQRAVAAIAEALANGLTHPGDPAQRQGPVALLNSTFRPQGRPPPLADSIRANNTAIAQAIVHLIENDLGYTLTETPRQ